eukprot:1063879_1
MDDLSISDIKRMNDSKEMALDFLITEKTHLKKQLDLVDQSMRAVNSISPERVLCAFKDLVGARNLDLAPPSIKQITDKFGTISDIVKSGILFINKEFGGAAMKTSTPGTPEPDTTPAEPSADVPTDATAQPLTSDTWLACFGVVTQSEFFHAFESDASEKPFVSLTLQSMMDVRDARKDFEGQGCVFQFSTRRWFGRTRLVFRTESVEEMAEWMAVLRKLGILCVINCFTTSSLVIFPPPCTCR